jgi:hypothetical protein
MSTKKSELVLGKVNDKGGQAKLLNVRATFVYLDKPQKDIDGDPLKGKYTVTAIIPKADFPGVKASFLAAAKQILKINKTLPTPDEREKCLRAALNDGNDYSFFKIGNDQTDKTGKVYKGLENAFTCVATIDAVHTGNGFRPKFEVSLKDRAGQTVAEHDIKNEFYSGCYVHLALNLYPYNFRGKFGIKAYLNGVLKVADGERLGASDPWADYVPEEIDETEETETDFSFGDTEPAKPAAKKGKPAAKKGKK